MRGRLKRQNARVRPRHEETLRRIFEADRMLERDGCAAESFRLAFSGESPHGEIEHRCWNGSWAVPSGETIDDLGELEMLRVEPPINKVRVFSLSMKGREEAERRFDPKVESAEPELAVERARDSRRVAVMHGRDPRARRWMYDWLRRIGLEPLEWGHLVQLTGKGSPYNGEAVDAAFRDAQAVVVLLTPDETGTLHPDLLKGSDASDAGPQPRLNVVLEAGMALQSHPNQTILVEIGSTRPISDLAGRNTIRLTGLPDELNELATRLENAGCKVAKTGSDWLETDDLLELPALRRTADPGYVVAPLPSGGLAAIGSEGSSYRVFRVRGDRIEYRVHEMKLWSGWSEIGAVDEEPIGLASASINRGHVEVFALLPRGGVLHNWWHHDEGWQPEFHSLGQPFGEQQVIRIDAGSKGIGHQEVFVEAKTGEIAHLWWERGWRRAKPSASSLGDGWWRFPS